MTQVCTRLLPPGEPGLGRDNACGRPAVRAFYEPDVHPWGQRVAYRCRDCPALGSSPTPGKKPVTRWTEVLLEDALALEVMLR